MQEIATKKVFNGSYKRFEHQSETTKTAMNFGVFLPSLAERQQVPAVLWLSGLTCTDENFMIKAGAQRYAEELGLAIVCPDTSPRGAGVSGEDECYDLGTGAGFYLDATEEPWTHNYQMESYILRELIPLCESNLPLNKSWVISGHSMGGHGALTLGLKHSDTFRAISAFAPICNPTKAPWGEKAFSAYLGNDKSSWQAYDSLVLLSQKENDNLPKTLIEQGNDDEFLKEQLGLTELETVIKERRLDKIEVNRRPGYDHSYFFISSFIGDHLRFLKEQLEA